jgi:hypothetical protein
LVDRGRAYCRLALGVLAGPLEAPDELCGEVGVVQLHGCHALGARRWAAVTCS